MITILWKILANLALLYIEWALKKGYLHENSMEDAKRNPGLRNALIARIDRLSETANAIRAERRAREAARDDQGGSGMGFRTGR